MKYVIELDTETKSYKAMVDDVDITDADFCVSKYKDDRGVDSVYVTQSERLSDGTRVSKYCSFFGNSTKASLIGEVAGNQPARVHQFATASVEAEAFVKNLMGRKT